MELLMRVVIYAVIVVAILLSAYYLFTTTIAGSVTMQQAESLVVRDLTSRYPNALINITNATPSSYPGSWYLVIGIIVNATSPCPSYFVDTFEYPEFGFVNRTQNTYTAGCTIKGFPVDQPFNLYSSPVAITRAHMLNISAVNNYINAFGFNNVVVYAHLLNKTSAQGVEYENVWLLNYSSAAASYYVYVLLSQPNGSLLNTYTAMK